MKCDVCGSDNLEGAAYCEDCGAKLVVPQVVAAVASTGGGGSAAPAVEPDTTTSVQPSVAPVAAPAATAGNVSCPSCGAENPETEQYCVDCGANLGTAAAAPEPATSYPVSTGTPVAAAEAPAATKVARLLQVSTNKEIPLDRELTTMGRRSPADQIEPDIDLTDDDPDSYVSRRHAKITRNDSEYIFEDVGSSNGSFINNVRAQPGVQQALKDSDKLRLGKTEFVFKA